LILARREKSTFMPKPSIDDPDRRTVLLVIGSLQGGGAERQISDMANYWAAKGWRVLLATWCGPEVIDFYPLDPRVSRVRLATQSEGVIGRSRIRANLQRVARLRAILKSTRPHAVLSFMTESNILTILAGMGLNLRVAVSERVQPAFHSAFPWTWRMLRRVMYALADAVVAQTEDAAQWLRRNCRAAVTVIPNALRDLPEASSERETLIIAVGRLAHQKGFDVLLRAFARIAPNFESWRLAIIGEGAERQTLERLCGELSLEDRVEFVGQTPDVVAWMVRAGLVVQPSRFEGFPNVVLESMGLGAPVISSDCHSGPSDLIEDGVNGRLVPVGEVEALAQVMAELMSNPDERARLGQAATGVRERYRQDAVIDRWEVCLFPGQASESR
jgi:GalNAc-alpha-(1->4)-GalNAc-alpha-(1->3)-diNAcBac-PP-undecaprenol alpha-1,4-N-acetyl-D-galactosaminyltransferase